MSAGTLVGTSGGVKVGPSGAVQSTNSAGACPTCGCGDGGQGPCCSAGNRCEVLPNPATCSMKTWVRATTTAPIHATQGAQLLTGQSATISGSAANEQDYDKFQNFDSTVSPPPPGCSLSSNGQMSSPANSSAVTIQGPLATGSITGGSALFRNTFESVPPPVSLRIGSGAASTDIWGILFSVGLAARTTDNANSAGAGVTFFVFLENGSLTSLINDQFVSGSVTPTLLMEGQCPVGIRADFNLIHTQYYYDPFPTLKPFQVPISGSIAVAFCKCVTGCGSAGTVCASVEMPNDPPPIDDDFPIDGFTVMVRNL